jgi:hypothetical protein
VERYGDPNEELDRVAIEAVARVRAKRKGG